MRRAGTIAIRLVALLALCVQLAVSIGHDHPGAVREGVAASVQCSESGQEHCLLPVHDEEKSDCSYCLAMRLIASAVVPLPPEIALPVLFEARPEPVRQVQIAAFETARNYRARAPPRL